jgi:hypothetical protein
MILSLQHVGSVGSALLGMLLILDGVRRVVNRHSEIDDDAALEKKLRAHYTRYWIGRNYNGLDLVKAGMGFVALAAILSLIR